MPESKGYVSPELLKVIGEFVRALKRTTYEVLDVAPGEIVLDVGAGDGQDVVALAGLVGPNGRAIGVDLDPRMATKAAHNVRAAGADVAIIAADVLRLPFATGAFDACRAERVLQHVAEADRALTEMVRVLKPSGRLVILETDWASCSFDAEDNDLERRLARVRTDQSVNNGYVARQLFRLFRESALESVTVNVFPLQSTDVRFARRTTLLDDVERRALESGAVGRDS